MQDIGLEGRKLTAAAVKALPEAAEILVKAWEDGDLNLVKDKVIVIRRTLKAVEERIKKDLWQDLGITPEA